MDDDLLEWAKERKAQARVKNAIAEAIEHFKDEANYHEENHSAYWEGVAEGYRRAADHLQAVSNG